MGLGFHASVSDEGNGAYRIVRVERCDVVNSSGINVCENDFLQDIVECSLSLLGVPGNADGWSATLDNNGAMLVVTAFREAC